MKLRDIMKLPELSGFKLISGSGGLDKYVDATEIIDFEFADGVEFTREEMFYGHSVGITSLMFARQKPELILNAVKQLDGMGVTCLCYKPIFFKELPSEVIEYSEKHDFPIFEITDDAFFEDIVLAIKKEVGQDMTESEIEGTLEALIVDELSDKDAERLRNRILPAMRKNVEVMCFAPVNGHEEEFDREHIIRCSRRIALNSRFGDRVSLVRFRQGGFLVLSRDEGGAGDMDVLMKDVIIVADLPEEKALWGKSRVLRRETGFAQVVKEAYWALRVCQIEGAHARGYDEIGIYRLIAPEMESKTLVANAHDYLKPIMEADEDGSLMETAVAYVLSGCDLNRTSEKLYCHKNTVRYRIKKIHDMIEPSSSEESFRESLNLAVRVLLLEGEHKTAN